MKNNAASPRTFDRLDWKTVRTALEATNRELAEALDPIAKRLKGQAFAYRGSYLFGAAVLDRGKLVLPEPAVDSDGIVLEGLTNSLVPLCVPLTSSFEVFHEPEPGAFRSLRVLNAGEVFGVFEASDRRFGLASGRNTDWSVAAGFRSAHLVYPTGNADLKHALWKYFGDEVAELNDLRHERSKPIPMAVASKLMTSLARRENSTWRAELLMLPSQWEGDFEAASQALERLAFRTTWAQVRPLQESLVRHAKLTPLVRYLFARLANPIGEPAATSLLNNLEAIASGATPAYRPHFLGPAPSPTANNPDGNRELFQNTLAGFHRCAMGTDTTPIILEPVHLKSSGDVAWCSLSCPAMPELFADVTSYAQVMMPFGELAHERSAELGRALPSVDLTALKMFCRPSGSLPMRPATAHVGHGNEIPQLCPELRGSSPLTKTGFFLGSLRLVRK